MRRTPWTIAVTGLNATDNPAPGIGVIRSLGAAGSGDRIIGLAYDALDPGLYAPDLVAEAFLLPYPSSSVEAFLSRLEYIHSRIPLDVVIPTLDSELPAFISLAPRLASMGIATLLPTRHGLDQRSKASLPALGLRADMDVPTTAVLAAAEEVLRVHQRIPYPFMVKGLFYGATRVTCQEEALAAFHKVAAQWGMPVVVQACVTGEELNLVGLGQGDGTLWGAVGMKKLLLTDQGKGWAGITIADPDLVAVAERFAKSTAWRGPFEVEVIRDAAGRYQLIEINPRFPAWVHLATAAGMNLPHAVAELARGLLPKPQRDYQVGTMFVRIAIDQIATVAHLERILTSGEIMGDRSS